MPSKETKAREEAVITAQGQLDAAPSKGKGTYLKLPDGVRFFIPEKGRTYHLIFLPWKAGKHNTTGAEGSWVTNRFIPVHRGVGPGEESFICLARSKGQPCPVCEGFGLLRSMGKDWDAIKDLRYKDRELFFVHDVDDNRNPRNLMVWDESVHLFGDAFRGKYRKKQEWMCFADFKKGSVVEIECKEKKIGKNTCIDMTQGIEIEPRREPLEDWLVDAAKKFCIDDCVVYHPYEKLKKLFGQTGGAKQGEETPDEPREEPEEEEEAEEPEEKEAEEPEEGEEEEEEEEAAGVEKGDTVDFEYKGKKRKGEVIKVKGDLVTVKSADREAPYTLEIGDVTKQGEEEEPEEEEEEEEEEPEEPEEEEEEEEVTEKPKRGRK